MVKQKEKISTTEIFPNDKEWLRRMKIKHNFPGIKEAIKWARRIIQKHKMENEE